MTQDKYTRPDNTTQSASAYKANIDNGFEAFERASGSQFQGHEETSPAMTVRLEAGDLWDGPGNAPDAIAAQSTGTITAPVTNPRIDRVVIDTSGVVSVITGTENASPTAPAVTAGKIPICQVALATSTTSITNSLITDERPSYLGDPSSAVAGLTDIVDDTTPQLGAQLDVNGFGLGDGTLELLTFTETGSAVNHVNLTNAATGNGPTIAPAGDDTNVPLNIVGKGSGQVQLGDAALTFPDADGTANQVIQTDGAGALSFASVSGGDLTFVSSATASASASVEFTDLNTATSDYVIIISHLVPATDGAELWYRVSTDNGSTYKSGASDYKYAYTHKAAATQSTAADHVVIVDSTGSGSNETAACEVKLIKPQSTAGFTQGLFQGGANKTQVEDTTGSGYYTATTAVDAIQFLMSTGNIASGNFYLYEIKGV